MQAIGPQDGRSVRTRRLPIVFCVTTAHLHFPSMHFAICSSNESRVVLDQVKPCLISACATSTAVMYIMSAEAQPRRILPRCRAQIEACGRSRLRSLRSSTNRCLLARTYRGRLAPACRCRCDAGPLYCKSINCCSRLDAVRQH
jgi:hypothetical protein